MQVQQCTNIPEGEWWPCKTVTLSNGVLECLLEPNRAYDLAEAYEKSPHVRFANAESDRELVDFIREWGPPWILPSGIPTDGVLYLPLSQLRAHQRHVKTLLDGLTAFKWARSEREALGELIAAQVVLSGGIPDPLFLGEFQITGNVAEWLKSANLKTVRAATGYLVNRAVMTMFSLQLTFQMKGNRRDVEAGWNFMNLRDALLWMIWYDEFTKHPVICCAECRMVFRGGTARARKYCSLECGHRATAREAMRKKRAAERAERK
jgi:hypothetical protein